MTKPPALPLLLLVTLLGACSASGPRRTGLEWRKSSDFAPSLDDARQNCKAQVAAETLGKQGAPVVSGDFVKCMRAAGWTLVDHGTE